MKIGMFFTMICLLTVTVSEAGEQAASDQQGNFAGTRSYYSKLISGDRVRLAELNLFTNMLPKGGDLHHHYSGAIYAETYLDWVDAQKYCIYSQTDTVLKIKKFTVETKPEDKPPAARALCLNANALRLDKDDTFYRDLLKRWSDKDYHNHFHEQPPPDKQFFDTFGYFGPVSGYAYNQGLRALKARAQAENVGYLETMLKGSPTVENPALNGPLNALDAKSSSRQVEEAFAGAYDLLAHDTETGAKIDGYLKMAEDAAADIDDENFRLRFQAYVSRNAPPATVFSGLYTAFAAAARSKRVVGVNIVGPENGYVALRHYSLHMQMFAFLKQRFSKVKVAMHAGELTLGMVTPETLRSHIREAVLVAGADRIGHGVDIPHEADALDLLKIMRERKVAVEINLSSNAFILGVENDAHPLPLYRWHEVPVVISTDDPGVSRSNLSGEYLLYVSRYRPSYEELKEVVYNSIRYSFLLESEKRDEMAKLDRRFLEFERRVAGLARLTPPAKTGKGSRRDQQQ